MHAPTGQVVQAGPVATLPLPIALAAVVRERLPRIAAGQTELVRVALMAVLTAQGPSTAVPTGLATREARTPVSEAAAGSVGRTAEPTWMRRAAVAT
jgi:hypothetical protein